MLVAIKNGGKIYINGDIITCPCLIPLVDYRVDRTGIPYFPDDFNDTKNVKIEKIVGDGKIGKKGERYIMVLYQKPPKGVEPKRYDVEGHEAYAGCASVKDGKLSCSHKSLFYVLHPEKEWKSFHEIK